MREQIVIGLTPTFTSVALGKWKWRLATSTDVSNGDAVTVGDLIKEHSVDGIWTVDKASVA